MTGFLLGVADHLTLAFEIKFYPNPPHNTITVELNSLNSNTEITITNIMGKKIYVQKVAVAASPLDISDFKMVFIF